MASVKGVPLMFCKLPPNAAPAELISCAKAPTLITFEPDPAVAEDCSSGIDVDNFVQSY